MPPTSTAWERRSTYKLVKTKARQWKTGDRKWAMIKYSLWWLTYRLHRSVFFAIVRCNWLFIGFCYRLNGCRSTQAQVSPCRLRQVSWSILEQFLTKAVGTIRTSASPLAWYILQLLFCRNQISVFMNCCLFLELARKWSFFRVAFMSSEKDWYGCVSFSFSSPMLHHVLGGHSS